MDLQRHPCISAASHQNLKTAVFLVFPAVTAAVQHLVKPTPRSASRSAATTPQPPPSQTTSPRPVASPGRPLGSTRGKETSQGRRVRAGVPEGITEVDGKGKKKSGRMERKKIRLLACAFMLPTTQWAPRSAAPRKWDASKDVRSKLISPLVFNGIKNSCSRHERWKKR